MMAVDGLAFAVYGDEWRMVMCEDEQAASKIQHALAKWMSQSDEPGS